YMPVESIRPVNREYAVRADDHVSFADGYPILIVSQESLDDLNARLERPLPMERFRPNLAVAGCRAFEEDGWKRIRVGEVELALVKPCARCEVTTIDQASAARGKEPLKALAAFRRADGNKVLFGMNAIPLNEGRLRVGDPVEVVA
ncbi:MAG: MOSC domain-containing protein, partial [Anaerolineales bacterium]